MNKKLFVAAVVALAGAFSAPVFAQDAAPAQNTDQQKARKGNKNGQARQKAPNPFEGLNLTTEQQTKLDNLRKAEGEQRKAMAQKMGEEAKKKQAENKQRREEAVKQFKAKRSEKLAKIKEILTPEQYVTFLENQYLNAPGMRPSGPQNGKRGDMKRAPRGDKKDNKGQRPQKPQKQD